MPKGVNNARTRNSGDSKGPAKPLEFKTIDQEYAFITKALGDCRFESRLPDNTTRIAHVRGSLKGKSKSRVYPGDLVLVSEREFEKGKVDIIHLYAKDDVRSLKKLGEITEAFISGKSETNEVDFGEEENDLEDL